MNIKNVLLLFKKNKKKIIQLILTTNLFHLPLKYKIIM